MSSSLARAALAPIAPDKKIVMAILLRKTVGRKGTRDPATFIAYTSQVSPAAKCDAWRSSGDLPSYCYSHLNQMRQLHSHQQPDSRSCSKLCAQCRPRIPKPHIELISCATPATPDGTILRARASAMTTPRHDDARGNGSRRADLAPIRRTRNLRPSEGAPPAAAPRQTEASP